MKNKKYYVLLFIAIFIILFPTAAYANSSWHWLTTTTPFDILPYVVVLTLAIEYVAIKKHKCCNHYYGCNH
jgi:hypothetical protein